MIQTGMGAQEVTAGGAPVVEGEQKAMTQIPVRARHGAQMTAVLVLLAGLALGPVFSTAADAQAVVLLVDGQPITALDIEQRSKFIVHEHA